MAMAPQEYKLRKAVTSLYRENRWL